MSDLAITVEKIEAIKPHPHADRLEIIQILGTQCVEQIGKYKVGQHVIYFPPGMLLPADVSAELGVTKYLKHARWDGDKIQCRVAACRLRTEPSYGFIIPLHIDWPIATDLTSVYEARQYVPPPLPGEQAPPHDDFHCYTDIAHYWQYSDAIPEGTMVRITEKLHGTNSRVGVVQVDGEWQYMAGSHAVCWDQPSRYWDPLEDSNVLRLINFLCDEQYPVTIYGEIFGPGVQDMDYGLDYSSYRVFDIKVAGQFLNFDDLKDACDFWQVPMVPTLYKGPFRKDLVAKFTDGVSAICDPEHIRAKFKGREGIVITPLMEQWSEELLGRLVLKSLSVDYLDRKGAQDNA
jgi:RNA ligase (TIGR02306 family)